MTALVIAGGVAAAACASGSGAPDPLAATSDESSLPAPDPSSTSTASTSVETANTAPATTGPPGATTTTQPDITPTPADQPACESVPLTPPSLVDGTVPADPAIEDQPPGSVARWGAPDSPFAVSQSLGANVDSSWIDEAIANDRSIEEGDWQAATVPVGDPPLGAISIYVRNTSTGCLRSYFVGPGLFSNEANKLAEMWVTAFATGAPVDPPDNSEVEFGYFGRRFEVPTFKIDQFDSSGPAASSLSDADISILFERDLLDDGGVLTLQGSPSPDRCINRGIDRPGGTDNGFGGALTAARSLAVMPGGSVLATRDVCPDRARWGDPTTFSELITLDPTATNPVAVTLRTWQADPELIEFEDASRVIAFGERRIEDVSPDGRYVSLHENYATDASRWELLDLANDASLVVPPSTCERSGQIVGPPRFVSDSVVVVARRCAQLHNGQDPEGVGEGDVQIEAIDLAADRPSDSIVWNGSVPGLGVDESRQSVRVSARQADDGTIWVIVSGNGGFESASETFVLHDAQVLNITRLGYQTFAFDPADLITEFDTFPI